MTMKNMKIKIFSKKLRPLLSTAKRPGSFPFIIEIVLDHNKHLNLPSDTSQDQEPKTLPEGKTKKLLKIECPESLPDPTEAQNPSWSSQKDDNSNPL